MNIKSTWNPVLGFEDRYKTNLNGDVRAICRTGIDKDRRSRIYKDHVMTVFIDPGG